MLFSAMSSPGEVLALPNSPLLCLSNLSFRKIFHNPFPLPSSQRIAPPTAPISARFFRLDPGPELVYTYTYDEMKIIVDGDFEISDEAGKSVKAVKGDVFFFPKGSKITLRTEKGGLG